MKKTFTLFGLFIIIGLLVNTKSTAQNRTIYVDSAATGANDGSSWADAYQYLSDALTEANADPNVTEVKIAKGTYYPTGDPTGTDREASFVVTRDHLKIIGGYRSGGASRVLTGMADQGTILSGNIGDPNSNTDNSFHVMLIANITGSDSIVLDGLQVSDGRADEGGRHSFPGIVLENTGAAGIYISVENIPVIIERCIFTRNFAVANGGSIYIEPDVTNTRINNSVFFGNLNALGSAIHIEGEAAATNCTIANNDNSAISIYNEAHLSLYNCILSNDSEVYISGNDISLSFYDCMTRGSILWGAIENAVVATEYIEDPEFVDPENGDFRLKQSSPAINRGSISDLPGDPTSDIVGNPRVIGKTIDMGAFEFQVLDNNISNNGDDNFIGMNGSLNITGSDVTSGVQPVSYFWKLDIFGTADTETIDTTLLINPEDYAGLPLELLGVSLDSNHFILNDLSNMPSLIDLAAGSGGNNYEHFVGDVTFSRLASAGHYQNISNSEKITITSDATPVAVFDFRGKLTNGVATLQWQTGVENNLRRFELQRNTNHGSEQSWETLAIITSKGIGSSYQFSTSQTTPKAIYRLKAIDKSGSFKFADNIVALKQQGQPLTVYPNPATAFINLWLQQAAKLVIYDGSGKQVLQQSLNAGDNRINVKELATGIYYGRLSNGESFRFLKQ